MAPVRLPIASHLMVGTARVAQSEERLTRNEQVRGSNPRAGSWWPVGPARCQPIWRHVSVLTVPTHRMRTMNLLAGVIWHYWLAVPLVGGGILLCVATLVGYLKKVSATRYPGR